jgi:hypothetical protein
MVLFIAQTFVVCLVISAKLAAAALHFVLWDNPKKQIHFYKNYAVGGGSMVEWLSVFVICPNGLRFKSWCQKGALFV